MLFSLLTLQTSTEEELVRGGGGDADADAHVIYEGSAPPPHVSSSSPSATHNYDYEDLGLLEKILFYQMFFGGGGADGIDFLSQILSKLFFLLFFPAAGSPTSSLPSHSSVSYETLEHVAARVVEMMTLLFCISFLKHFFNFDVFDSVDDIEEDELIQTSAPSNARSLPFSEQEAAENNNSCCKGPGYRRMSEEEDRSPIPEKRRRKQSRSPSPLCSSAVSSTSATDSSSLDEDDNSEFGAQITFDSNQVEASSQYDYEGVSDISSESSAAVENDSEDDADNVVEISDEGCEVSEDESEHHHHLEERDLLTTLNETHPCHRRQQHQVSHLSSSLLVVPDTPETAVDHDDKFCSRSASSRCSSISSTVSSSSSSSCADSVLSFQSNLSWYAEHYQDGNHPGPPTTR